MTYDPDVLEEVLAEYPPAYAYLARRFLATYEKRGEKWVRVRSKRPLPMQRGAYAA